MSQTSISSFLKRHHMSIFILYNVVLIIISSIALIRLVTQRSYLEPTSSSSNIPVAQVLCVLLPTLATMLTAGVTGGVLCNLRGIFKYYRERGSFPEEFVVPFYIRPVLGAATGLLTFFLGNLITSSLSDASNLSWVTLTGRLSYIAVALLAGFGSQEFMERMKEVAKTLFSEQTTTTSAQKVELARWDRDENQVVGPNPEELSPVSADELILLYGDIQGNREFHWRVFRAGETICKPLGTSVAFRIWGGTDADRQTLAEQAVKLVAVQQGITDWRGVQATEWCR